MTKTHKPVSPWRCKICKVPTDKTGKAILGREHKKGCRRRSQ